MKVDLRERRKPEWLFNFRIADGRTEYEFLPTKVQCPAALPTELRTGGFLLKVTGPAESLLASALQAGIFLTVPQLTSIATALELPALPQEASKKKHRIQQILDHVFAERATAAQKMKMMSKMMNISVKKLTEEESNVLQMVGALDTENAECFKEIKDYAVRQLEQRLKDTGKKQLIDKMKKVRKAAKGKSQKKLRLKFLKKRRELQKKTAQALAPRQQAPADGEVPAQAPASGRGRGPAVSAHRVGVTPPTLKELLPGRGEHSNKFTPFRGNLANKHYRVGYKCSLSAS